MSKTNLLDETLATLKVNSKKPGDVEWVGSIDGEFAMSWNAFALMAKAVDYDDGYGTAEIADCLVVVGRGWWLEREEYDGSEWWEFKRKPRKKKSAKKFNSVTGGWHPSVSFKEENQ